MIEEPRSRFDDIADLLTESDKFQLAMTCHLLESANEHDTDKVLKGLHCDNSALLESVNAYIDRYSLSKQLTMLVSAGVLGGVTAALKYDEFGLATEIFVVLILAAIAYGLVGWWRQRNRQSQLRLLLRGLGAHVDSVEHQAIQRVVQKHRDALAPYALPADVKSWTMREYLIAFLVLR